MARSRRAGAFPTSLWVRLCGHPAALRILGVENHHARRRAPCWPAAQPPARVWILVQRFPSDDRSEAANREHHAGRLAKQRSASRLRPRLPAAACATAAAIDGCPLDVRGHAGAAVRVRSVGGEQVTTVPMRSRGMRTPACAPRWCRPARARVRHDLARRGAGVRARWRALGLDPDSARRRQLHLRRRRRPQPVRDGTPGTLSRALSSAVRRAAGGCEPARCVALRRVEGWRWRAFSRPRQCEASCKCLMRFGLRATASTTAC